MKAILKTGLLVLVPETAEETAQVAGWREGVADHVFRLTAAKGTGVMLSDLGPKDEACREPLNVGSRSTEPAARMISNFAAAPFELDSRQYACVEAFWQGLKFEKEADRRRIAVMSGPESRRAGEEKGYSATFEYEGRTIGVGTYEHRELMARACWAKFTQCWEAREALLSTGTRPLEHKMRRDSKTIPGAVMADIWMRIRAKLAAERATGK